VETICRELPALAGNSWEIRVVDDGSADDTADIIERLSAADPRIVLQPEPRRGKGAAVRAGMLAAAGELRFMCDADLSMPIRELRRFLQEVPSRCDVAIGCREGPGARRLGEPEYRHVMGRVFNALVRVTLLPGLNDTQCGFKLFSRAAAETIFPRVSVAGWAFDIEALYIARSHGLRVQEVPIEWHYGERSHVSPLRDAVGMTLDLVRIRANAARGRYR
jgi:glycosyltransferase involved in cell wall biosynthesis